MAKKKLLQQKEVEELINPFPLNSAEIVKNYFANHAKGIYPETIKTLLKNKN